MGKINKSIKTIRFPPFFLKYSSIEFSFIEFTSNKLLKF